MMVVVVVMITLLIAYFVLWKHFSQLIAQPV